MLIIAGDQKQLETELRLLNELRNINCYEASSRYWLNI